MILQAKQVGIKDAIFAGLSNWAVKEFLDSAQGAAEGTMFTDENFSCDDTHARYGDYCQAYAAANPSFSPTYAGAYAYDALSIIALSLDQLLQTTTTLDTDLLRQKMYEVSGFQGLMLTYDLTHRGKVSGGDYVIKMVDNGKFVTP